VFSYHNRLIDIIRFYHSLHCDNKGERHVSDKIKRFLVTTAQDAETAAAQGLPCAFLIYRIGPGGTLQRAQVSASLRGGIMGIYDGGGLAQAHLPTLLRSIYQEYRRQGFSGMILDIDTPRQLLQHIAQLSQQLHQAGIPHTVPLAAATAAPDARLLIPSSVSGGSFVQMLQDFSAHFGAARLCLDLERSCTDFPMPSHTPDGTPLTPRQFRDILQQHRPNSYFSQPLCSKYFTYRGEDGTHFVLYDDPGTAAQKVRLAQQAGFSAVFALYRDWGENSRSVLAAQ